jgi:acyl-CoA reductase-like NAD-dependent aldehyde dehydrogenase
MPARRCRTSPTSTRPRACDGWSQRTLGERALALLRIADTIEQRADELVAVESLKVGKPIAAAMRTCHRVC